MGLVKLNFDGNYIRGENRGGIGDVIRGNEGTMIYNYLELVVASDANEAKIYSLLIGCSGIKRLSGFKSIVKGDSKLAVLRGLSYQLYSWSLANLMEEIPTIST